MAGRGCAGTAIALTAGLTMAVGAVVLTLTAVVGRAAPDDCVVTLDDGRTAHLGADQADNAALLAAVALDRELPSRSVTVALATALQESKLRNIDYGDRDSLGLFQQRPSQGWGSPAEVLEPLYATNAFYDALERVEGWEDADVTVAAQAVQRSGFPDAYAQHEGRARAFANALTGQAPATLVCRLGPEEAPVTVADLLLPRLERDFGTAASSAVGDAVMLGGPLEGTPEAPDDGPSSWALAHWAVATAHATGASVVVLDGLAWVRADGRDAGWAPVGDIELPESVAGLATDAGPGVVLVG